MTATTEHGVTYYQTRAARAPVPSPSNERTWLKTVCHADNAVEGGGVGGAFGVDGCAACEVRVRATVRVRGRARVRVRVRR